MHKALYRFAGGVLLAAVAGTSILYAQDGAAPDPTTSLVLPTETRDELTPEWSQRLNAGTVNQQQLMELARAQNNVIRQTTMHLRVIKPAASSPQSSNG